MKAVMSVRQASLLIILVVLLAAVPLAGISCSDDDEPEVTLRWAHEVTEGQISGKVAIKFAELVDEYTDGKVAIEIFPQGTLYSGMSLTDAVENGDVDMITHHPAYFRIYLQTEDNFVLDPMMGIYAATIGSPEHGNAVMEDDDLLQLLRDDWEDRGVYWLGYVPESYMAGFFADKEMVKATDAAGLNWACRSTASIIEEYAQVNVNLNVPNMDIPAGLGTGLYDGAGNSLSGAVQQGYMDVTGHAWLFPVPSYMHTMFNLDSWNSLEPDIQELITDTIWPEAYAYGEELCLEAHKESLLTMVTDLDTVHLASNTELATIAYIINNITEIQQMYTYKMNADLMALIEEHDPGTVTWNEPILEEILEYAGLTVPTS